MLEFKWPYFIFLLPLPTIFVYLQKLYYKLIPNKLNNNNTNNKNTGNTIGLYLPFYDELIANYNITNINKASNLTFKNLIILLIWLSFVLAIMRPIWYGDPISLQTPSHDIIMAIDISGSMQATDMNSRGDLNRLDVVKQIGHQFIDKRLNDRIGLVFFGSSAFVSTPLTLDQKSLHSFLEKTQIGFAGKKTAIGDAIGLAIKRIRSGNTTNDSSFIILLSDGSNTSGEVDPIDAANIAAKNKVKIYTIGIGSNANNTFDIMAGMALDERTLKSIAQITDGRYFHATSQRALELIYEQINKLEPTSLDEKTLRPETEWFIYPLVLMLIASILFYILNYTKNES